MNQRTQKKTPSEEEALHEMNRDFFLAEIIISLKHHSCQGYYWLDELTPEEFRK